MKTASYSIRHAEPCADCGATEQERIDIGPGEWKSCGVREWHGYECRGCGKPIPDAERETRERDDD